jgi:hypothetical protein
VRSAVIAIAANSSALESSSAGLIVAPFDILIILYKALDNWRDAQPPRCISLTVGEINCPEENHRCKQGSANFDKS